MIFIRSEVHATVVVSRNDFCLTAKMEERLRTLRMREGRGEGGEGERKEGEIG